MRCKEIEKLLPDYVSGDISAPQRQFVEEHLSRCTRCRKALAAYNEAKQYLTSLEDSPVPPEFTQATMTKVKAATKSRSQQWLRPALAAGAAVVILAILLVTQPWGVSPQSVMARACAATEGLQSYRMSSYMTSIFNGETEEQTCEMAFAAPDRYHVRATIDDERHELIIISGRLYRYQPDEPDGPQSSQVTVAVSPGSLLSKEYTLQILDNLANLETLPDGEIEGVECLHYRGRVDMERMIEEQTASLDPEQPGYEEMVKAMEQTREQAHQMKIEVELWIGKDDYLIRQMVQTTRFPDSEGQLQTSSTTLTFYDFNQPIAIEPPLDASGQLLTGWQLAGSITPDSKQPVLGRNITSSIGAQEGYNDWAHQEVKYSITIINNSVETVKNVRLTITTMLTDEANKPATVEAEPETSADIIAPGESRTYHAHCPFDASDYTKEDILELQDVTTILVHFTTEGGQELTELLFPDAPYPTKTPPEGPPD